MATVESLVLAALEAESTLTAIVGTRIYCNELPQNPTYPALVYTTFSDEYQTFAQDTELGTVQIDCFGTRHTSEAISMRTPVKTAMEGASSLISIFNGHQSRQPEDTIEAERETLSFVVYY